jgi:hypothetical protein
MQTSIEWFIEHLLGNGLLRLTKEDHNLYSELRDKAKEMHKQEIINTYNEAYEQCLNQCVGIHKIIISEFKKCNSSGFEVFYNKRFGEIKTKTPILEWDNLDKCSTRLKKVLLCISKSHSYYYEQFIENISKKEMAKIRNCGSETIKEFIRLRGGY